MVICSVPLSASSIRIAPATFTVFEASATCAGSKRTTQPVTAWCRSSTGWATLASNAACSPGVTKDRTSAVAPWTKTAGDSEEATR